MKFATAEIPFRERLSTSNQISQICARPQIIRWQQYTRILFSNQYHLDNILELKIFQQLHYVDSKSSIRAKNALYRLYF